MDGAIIDYFTLEPIMLRYTDAIVVGSSGNLIGRRLGEEIDATDVVIRMNTAPTRGYENDVGSKTTIRVVAHNAIKDELLAVLKGVEYLIVWGAEEHYTKLLKKMVVIQQRFPQLRICRLSNEAMILNDQEFELRTGVNRLGSGAWLSTGWFSIFVALNIVTDMIKICGYGCARDSQRGVLYHYWERKFGNEIEYIRKNQRSIKGHRFLTEIEIFAEWSKKYSIKFI